MIKATRPALILAGDIGGTKTRLGLFHISKTDIRLLTSTTYPSKAYRGLEFIIGEFIQGQEQIAAASFGVAGPVVNGIAIATNLSWKISETSLIKLLRIKKIALINDLVANAYGIDIMTRKDFTVLNERRRAVGNKALLSAGTGLGAAFMFWDGRHYVPSPSEGGHVEFGPRNTMELSLLRYLHERYGHVSYERALSGAGLFNIYQFLRDSCKFGKEPGWLVSRLAKEDPAAVIAESARRKVSRLCAESLDLFVSIYGAAAGNLALQVLATGGIYIGGGIAPRIVWKLMDGTFMKAFKDKGRLSSIVKSIPVRVIMNDRAALHGAAAHAANMLLNKE
jgi:glucokinase